MEDQEALTIAGVSVSAGERRRIEVPVAETYGTARTTVPIVVVRGSKPGPRLFVSAAVHGDEINGVEIIRRLLTMSQLKRIRGSLIAVPIVNVYGFLTQTRYLPDRRDLNRSFPGSPKGSLASRLARVFMDEVVSNATHGIDLHTASAHRANLPQIRACLDQEETLRLAQVFGAPVVIDANVRDGSLRQAVLERKIPMLLYEGGEALRFDEISIRAGVRGIVSVMRSLEMLPGAVRQSRTRPVIAKQSYWVRADESGLLRATTPLGTKVAENGTLGIISDPVGDHEARVVAQAEGIVIGRTNLPLVNEGDALFHVATFNKPAQLEARIEDFRAELDPALDASTADNPLLDD